MPRLDRSDRRSQYYSKARNHPALRQKVEPPSPRSSPPPSRPAEPPSRHDRRVTLPACRPTPATLTAASLPAAARPALRRGVSRWRERSIGPEGGKRCLLPASPPTHPPPPPPSTPAWWGPRRACELHWRRPPAQWRRRARVAPRPSRRRCPAAAAPRGGDGGLPVGACRSMNAMEGAGGSLAQASFLDECWRQRSFF